MILNYFKRYRKWVGGKWYKVIYFNGDMSFIYYTKKRPKELNHFIIKKYKY